MNINLKLIWFSLTLVTVWSPSLVGGDILCNIQSRNTWSDISDCTGTIERYVKVLENGFIIITQNDPDFKKELVQDGDQPHRAKKVFDFPEEHLGDRNLVLGSIVKSEF